jgi:hypothetical protein
MRGEAGMAPLRRGRFSGVLDLRYDRNVNGQWQPAPPAQLTVTFTVT